MNTQNATNAGAQSPERAVSGGIEANVFGGALLGAGAVIVWNDVAQQGRDQFYAWHDKEHIPERLGIPGFRRGRRYIKQGHSPEWLTVYETTDLRVVVSPEYLERLNSPTPDTVKTLRYFQNTSRAVCQLVHSLGSSSGGHVLAMRLDVTAAQTDAMTEYLTREAFARVSALTGVVACHLYMVDQPASYLNTVESSTRTFDVPSWVLLIEASTVAAAEQARILIDESRLASLGATARRDAAVYSLEICRLAQSGESIPNNSSH